MYPLESRRSLLVMYVHRVWEFTVLKCLYNTCVQGSLISPHTWLSLLINTIIDHVYMSYRWCVWRLISFGYFHFQRAWKTLGQIVPKHSVLQSSFTIVPKHSVPLWSSTIVPKHSVLLSSSTIVPKHSVLLSSSTIHTTQY